MLYTHFCKECLRIYLLSGHRKDCPACGQKLCELQMSYLDYVNMDQDRRSVLMESLLEEK